MENSKGLELLVADCLDSPGDPAMIAPMLKAGRVLDLNEAEMKAVAGGPRISSEGTHIAPLHDSEMHIIAGGPRVSNEGLDRPPAAW